MTKTKTQHTPGPWLAREMISGNWQVSRDDSGSTVAHVRDGKDARLIAAAPRLLAALRLAYGELLFMQDRDEEVLAVIEAAIAEAEGRGQ